MGFLQNSILTVTTSITKCCLSQPFPLPACWILDLVGYPCCGAGELLCVQHGSGHPGKQLPSIGEQEGWHSLAGGVRRGGSKPPTLQQSKGKGTSLTMLGGNLQEAAVLALLGIPKAQPLLSMPSEGQRSSTQHQRKETASFPLSPLNRSILIPLNQPR